MNLHLLSIRYGKSGAAGSQAARRAEAAASHPAAGRGSMMGRMQALAAAVRRDVAGAQAVQARRKGGKGDKGGKGGRGGQGWKGGRGGKN